MKKLLGLLSILTISGTSVPTTIAAIPYQKEEIIKNSEINYQQTNNLENLSRIKRNTNNVTNYWIMDINDFKNNIKFEKEWLLRRLPRETTEEQKINKILELQSQKIQELENKVNKINYEISKNGNEEDKNKHFWLKICQGAGGYVSLVAGSVVIVPALGTGLAALLAAIGGAAALICSLV